MGSPDFSTRCASSFGRCCAASSVDIHSDAETDISFGDNADEAASGGSAPESVMASSVVPSMVGSAASDFNRFVGEAKAKTSQPSIVDQGVWTDPDGRATDDESLIAERKAEEVYQAKVAEAAREAAIAKAITEAENQMQKHLASLSSSSIGTSAAINRQREMDALRATQQAKANIPQPPTRRPPPPPAPPAPPRARGAVPATSPPSEAPRIQQLIPKPPPKPPPAPSGAKANAGRKAEDREGLLVPSWKVAQEESTKAAAPNTPTSDANDLDAAPLTPPFDPIGQEIPVAAGGTPPLIHPPVPTGRVFGEVKKEELLSPKSEVKEEKPSPTTPIYKAPPPGCVFDQMLQPVDEEMSEDEQFIKLASDTFNLTERYDFELGCMGALRVAVDQKEQLDQALIMADGDYTHTAALKAGSIVIAIEAALLSLPASDRVTLVDGRARAVVVSELEDILARAKSIIATWEAEDAKQKAEALAKCQAAEAARAAVWAVVDVLDDGTHAIPAEFQDQRIKSLPKTPKEEIEVKAEEQRRKAAEKGLVGADVWSFERKSARKLKQVLHLRAGRKSTQKLRARRKPNQKQKHLHPKTCRRLVAMGLFLSTSNSS